MVDIFKGLRRKKSDPAENAIDVTPSDSVALSFVSRALICSGTGTVRVTMFGNDETVDLLLSAGFPLAVRVTHVHATGTTATGIVGLY